MIGTLATRAAPNPLSTTPTRGLWHEAGRRLMRDRVVMVSAAILALLSVLAVTAPVLSDLLGIGYSDQDLLRNFAPPGSPGHPLGTDELGRDMLVRLVWGAQVSLFVGLITVAISVVIGSTVGLLAAHYSGLVDDLLMRSVDVVLAIPSILLFILISIIFSGESSLLTLSLTLASVGWAGTARLVRGQALSVKEQEFVLAARAVGASDRRIIVRHLLPNALHVVIVYASLAVPGVILTEAGLSFLGFGIHQPTPSWGNMLTRAQVYFVQSPWLVLMPGLLIFVTVQAFNLIGNGVRDALDPRLRHHA